MSVRSTAFARPSDGLRLARKVALDGYVFDSAGESRRYLELKLLAQAGLIRELEVHPRFDLVVNNTLIGHYTADFRYSAGERGLVVEDVKTKGSRTRDYRLRRRIVHALYGVEVMEIEPPRAPRRRR